MRNVIFADVRTGATREGRTLLLPPPQRGEEDSSVDESSVRPSHYSGGKERGIFEIKRLTARRARRSNRRRNLHTKCIYVYGMYALVNALRENSVALSPSNETFNNFPRRKTEGDGGHTFVITSRIFNAMRFYGKRSRVRGTPRSLTIRCRALITMPRI